MDRLHLLPPSSTPFEKALAETLDPTPDVAPGIVELHSFKLDTPQPSILPWLVVEYGLGTISQYLPDLASVIEYGLRWQRVKGTPQGIAEALSWVGYAFDAVYEYPTRRTRWHLYELEMDRHRDSEGDLGTIEAVVRLSDPVRSEFFRAYHGYNVREVDWGHTRWGHAIWGDVSGVRLHPDGAKWSYGRTFEPPNGRHELTQAELEAAGAWVPSVEDGGIKWGAFPWTTPGLSWVSAGAETRFNVIATTLLAKACWIGIYRQDGTAIGFRKARVFRAVAPQFGGYYRAGSATYIASAPAGSSIYVEALTNFGEGDGETAHSWSITLGGSPPPGTKSGKMWLAGNAITGGSVVGGFAISPALFGKTSRERFRTILKIV